MEVTCLREDRDRVERADPIHVVLRLAREHDAHRREREHVVGAADVDGVALLRALHLAARLVVGEHLGAVHAGGGAAVCGMRRERAVEVVGLWQRAVAVGLEELDRVAEADGVDQLAHLHQRRARARRVRAALRAVQHDRHRPLLHRRLVVPQPDRLQPSFRFHRAPILLHAVVVVVVVVVLVVVVVVVLIVVLVATTFI